jgi:hypothetical protein
VVVEAATRTGLVEETAGALSVTALVSVALVLPVPANAGWVRATVAAPARRRRIAVRERVGTDIEDSLGRVRGLPRCCDMSEFRDMACRAQIAG